MAELGEINSIRYLKMNSTHLVFPLTSIQLHIWPLSAKLLPLLKPNGDIRAGLPFLPTSSPLRTSSFLCAQWNTFVFNSFTFQCHCPTFVMYSSPKAEDVRDDVSVRGKDLRKIKEDPWDVALLCKAPGTLVHVPLRWRLTVPEREDS